MPFSDAAAWEEWLTHNHISESEIWIKLAKKGSGIPSVTYGEAVDGALCYGWIDGQRKSHDENYFIQKFTPRRSKSIWSKINVAKVAQLIESGRMQVAGLAEVEAAKKEGRWDAAYDSPKNMEIPADLLLALEKNKVAKTHFEKMSKTALFSVCFRLHKAKKQETRERQIAALIEKLNRGEIPR